MSTRPPVPPALVLTVSILAVSAAALLVRLADGVHPVVAGFWRTGAVGLLLKLEDAVDFDAVDGRPVDLVFVLLVPEQNPEQHLKTLSHLASLFNDDDYRSDLRRAHSNQQLFQVAVESEAELRLAS